MDGVRVLVPWGNLNMSVPPDGVYKKGLPAIPAILIMSFNFQIVCLACLKTLERASQIVEKSIKFHRGLRKAPVSKRKMKARKYISLRVTLCIQERLPNGLKDWSYFIAYTRASSVS